MLFASLPEPFSPVGAPLPFTLADASPDGTELRILDDEGRLLGSKRIVGRTDITVDIAPYLRPLFRFDPSQGPTELLDAADRLLTVVVEARTATATCRTHALPVVAADRCAVRSALLTTLPPNRLIAPDGFDELTLRTVEPIEIVVTAERRGTRQSRTFALPAAGLHRFRLCAADFPEAERLTVDAGVCGRVLYTVLPPPDGARTVAWRSRVGSVERYVFPVVRRVTRQAVKCRGQGAAGIVVGTIACEERIELQAACETAAVVAALAELPAAREAWWIDGDRAIPIDVLTESCEVSRYGSMGAPVFLVRSTRPAETLWSC